MVGRVELNIRLERESLWLSQRQMPVLFDKDTDTIGLHLRNISTDSLAADTGPRVDYVLTNPPFGKKSSITFTNEGGEQGKEDLTYNRQDFWATRSNKQLNFIQHIHTILKTTGTAAVVLPDNVLFEGGAGKTVHKKRKLLHKSIFPRPQLQ